MSEPEAELEKINLSFPRSKELGGWIPIDVVEERGIVIAEKEIDGKFVLRRFDPVAIWRKVYDLMVSRQKIWREMAHMPRRVRQHHERDGQETGCRWKNKPASNLSCDSRYWCG